MSSESLLNAAAATITLPAPRLTGTLPVEAALFVRRSIREYSNVPLTLAELAQLLWSCQGITSVEGFRTTPSAGAIFPLEMYAVVERVEGLEPGVYHYRPGRETHAMELVRAGRFGAELCGLSTTQEFIRDVPLNLVMGSVTQRMIDKYGEAPAPGYVLLEMGHAAQNIHLQAEALGLGSVAVGYMNEGAVRDLLRMGEAQPLYLVSVGRKKETV